MLKTFMNVMGNASQEFILATAIAAQGIFFALAVVTNLGKLILV